MPVTESGANGLECSEVQPKVNIVESGSAQLRNGTIRITPVENDKEPGSLIILTNLKTLFHNHLPSMGRNYITRVVYDDTSKSLAIVKRGFKVVGGICYRPFSQRGFIEVVFVATASGDQAKGYGALLMNHFKAYIRHTHPEIMHFLTYADNAAVGFFEKQGFSTEITLDRSVWVGYIKDYHGATKMQCTLLPKVDYLNQTAFLVAQYDAVLWKIREMSRSHIVYPGLSQFQHADGEVAVDYREVPGLRESGWSPTMNRHVKLIPRSSDHVFMQEILKKLKEHSAAWPFQQPVNGDEVPLYYEVIKQPMDFATMGEKLSRNRYTCLQDLLADAQLVFDNCRKFNSRGSVYVRLANKLELLLKELLSSRV
ncbi:histone acetyltransferase, GCN5 superfamily [Mycena crocata]|nr:histone acetyltransferase, GCN5 superfamily [Mycena crocata]